MKKKEIKDLLDQKMSNEVLKENRDNLATLMSRLRPGIVKVSITAKDISEELSNKIGKLCEEYHNTYACHRIKKTNLETNKAISTDIILINTDLFDIPIASWSTAEKRLNYYVFVIDPDSFVDQISDSSNSEESLNNPYFPIKRFYKTVIEPIIEEYGKESEYYKDVVSSEFNTNAACFGWFNVMEDKSKYEYLDNPFLNNEEHMLKLEDMDDEVLNAGLIATLDESRIYDKDSEYYELNTVYNFAKHRLLDMCNRHDVSPKKLMEKYYSTWRKSIAVSCLDWVIDLSENVVEYGGELKVGGFLLRFICYLNIICNAILRELDLTPSFADFDEFTKERFETRYKEASDTCTYHVLGDYPENYYERLMGYETRALRKTLSEQQEKMDMKTKFFDMLNDSGLVEEIKKVTGYKSEEEAEEEKINSEDFKWS